MEPESAPTETAAIVLQPAGLGETLTAARERQGMSREQAARALHLSKKIVAALEDEDHEALPAPAYVKGYLRVYARVLEIDEQRLIEQYMALGVRDPELSASRPLKEGAPNRLSVGLSAGVIALVSVALSALWWNTQQRELVEAASIDNEPSLAARESRTMTDVETGERLVSARQRQAKWESAYERAVRHRVADQNVTARRSAVQDNDLARRRDGTQNAERTNGPDAPLAARELYAANLESLAVRRGASPGAPDAAQQDDTVAPDTASASESAASATATTPDNNPPPDAADIRATDALDRLALRYRDDSWTEVRDARGRQLLYGMVAAGEARRVAGEAPFEVLLGRSRSVQLTINGETFDSSPYIRANDTARFTVDTTAGQ